MGPQIRIGISGWTYPHWRRTFYPAGLPRTRELEYASRQVDTIEINGSFYALQNPPTYERWRDATPDDFVFSVKANRVITHITRLTDLGEPLANFFASGMLLLAEKLGPILWQFPPNMKYDRARFERFFSALPRNTRHAARLARGHSAWMKWASVATEGDRSLHHCVEIRNKTFLNDEFLELLARQGITLVIADSGGKWPRIEKPTGSIVYIRLHGKNLPYAEGYDAGTLRRWRDKIETWGNQGDVYVYFDNDAKAHAPFDAITLKNLFTDSLKRAA